MSDAGGIIVDARGHRCPVPSLKLQKAMLTCPPGSRITVLATDPMARVDVPFLMQQTGGTTVDLTEDAGVLTIVVETACAG